IASCNLRSRTHSEAWGPPKKRQSSWASNLWCTLQNRWRQGKQLSGRRPVSGKRVAQLARTLCFAEFVYQRDTLATRLFSLGCFRPQWICAKRDKRSRIGRRKQGLHASLPSFRSTLWAPPLDEEPNRFCRSGSPD